jgi:hypothetical protein
VKRSCAPSATAHARIGVLEERERRGVLDAALEERERWAVLVDGGLARTLGERVEDGEVREEPRRARERLVAEQIVNTAY